jgi:D-glycero-D-manno-heptose 1,7-bisphosphate phosphatase
MKLAVLDKDGTLTTPKSGNKFVQTPADQVLIKGVVEGCQSLINAGYTLAIASNQGGVEAGHKTLDDAIEEMQYCLQLLAEFDIKIDRAMFCPDFNGLECYVVCDKYVCAPIDLDCWFNNLIGTYRKPGSGMLLLAATNEIDEAWMIGDREEDRLASEAAGYSFLDADDWRKGESPWII